MIRHKLTLAAMAAITMASQATAKTTADKPDMRALPIDGLSLQVENESPCNRSRWRTRAIWYLIGEDGTIIEVGTIDVRQRC